MSHSSCSPTPIPADPGPRRVPGREALFEAGAVHVCHVDLATLGERSWAALTAAEHARAANFLSAARGEVWRSARAVLRELLGWYVELAPADVRIACCAGGRPVLEGRPRLSFSVSHSGANAVYAFSGSMAVAVDIERLDRRGAFDELAVASRAFGAESARELARFEQPARRIAFLRSWTLHEARCKLDGHGLWMHRERRHVREGSSQAIDCPSHLLGALATADPPSELRYFDYPWRPAGAKTEPFPSSARPATASS